MRSKNCELKNSKSLFKEGVEYSNCGNEPKLARGNQLNQFKNMKTSFRGKSKEESKRKERLQKYTEATFVFINFELKQILKELSTLFEDDQGDIDLNIDRLVDCNEGFERSLFKCCSFEDSCDIQVEIVNVSEVSLLKQYKLLTLWIAADMWIEKFIRGCDFKLWKRKENIECILSDL